MNLISTSAFCTLGVLAACSLTEKQCSQGDWEAIGKSDGAQGRSAEYISKHTKTCAKYGLIVNQTLWSGGREEGLKSYCTVQNVYVQGRNGKNLRPVCPTGDLTVLQAANDKGNKYYQIQSEMENLDHEQSRLRYEISRLRGGSITLQSASRINSLRMQILQIELRINHLRLQLGRYDQA